VNDSRDTNPRESHRRAPPGLGVLVLAMLAVAACAPTRPRQNTDAVTPTTREGEAPAAPEPSSELLGGCYGTRNMASINSTSAWMWLTIYESQSFGRQIAYTACVPPGGTHTQKMMSEYRNPTWYFRAEMTHANCQQPVDCDTTMQVEQRYCTDSVVLRASPQSCWWEWAQ
jgi:hypothetical protein